MNQVSVFSAPQIQNFTLPSTLIYYIARNPFSAKGYLKLIQTCKYFFAKNPILFFDWVHRHPSQQWITYFNHSIVLNLETIRFKIWLTKTLDVETVASRSDVGSLLEKVYSCELRNLTMANQTMSWEDYQKLTNSGGITRFRFENVSIRESDGTMVPLERILERIPNVQRCS